MTAGWRVIWLVIVAAMAACGQDPAAGPSPTTGTSTPAPGPTSSVAPTSIAPAEGQATAPAGQGDGEALRYQGAYEPRVVAVHPHDTTSFTQGLEWYDGMLLESTGREGQSSLRLVDPLSGMAQQVLAVDDDLFAEGVTAVATRAIQLTWQDETLLVTDLPELTATGSTRLDRAYEGEGWGLCYDGTELVMSDGSDRLTFRHPDTFEASGQVAVTLDGEPLERLNELECIGDQVWANVWQTTTIVAIDPETGVVDATVDAAGLVPDGYAEDTAAVLNGIAYERDTGRFWLTGKLWPVIYEVDLEPETVAGG
jgi:glutamine cyclotransferase